MAIGQISVCYVSEKLSISLEMYKHATKSIPPSFAIRHRTHQPISRTIECSGHFLDGLISVTIKVSNGNQTSWA